MDSFDGLMATFILDLMYFLNDFAYGTVWNVMQVALELLFINVCFNINGPSSRFMLIFGFQAPISAPYALHEQL